FFWFRVALVVPLARRAAREGRKSGHRGAAALATARPGAGEKRHSPQCARAVARKHRRLPDSDGGHQQGTADQGAALDILASRSGAGAGAGPRAHEAARHLRPDPQPSDHPGCTDVQGAWRSHYDRPPLRMIQDRGIPWGLGSDATAVTPSSPFTTLSWAVTGKMIGGKQVLRQTISREEALIAHTRANAAFLFQEGNLGSL